MRGIASSDPRAGSPLGPAPRWGLEEAVLCEGVAQRLFGRAKPLCIGRFELGEKLGSGGMGEVWAAFDPTLERRVALKTLRAAELAGSARRRDLIEEARALARLHHPNVLAVHDVLEIDELVVIVMEHVEGESLASWARRAGPSRERRLAALEAAARGLMAAHAAGVIHFDFKPDNVLVERGGRVLVADFGLAGRLDRPRSVIGGTPGFAAPEQLGADARPDARADQFAFAATLCALLGQPLERDDDVRDTQAALERLGLGRARTRALQRALARDPEQRWPSMAALVDVLFVRPRARWRAALLGGGLALALGLGVASRELVDDAPTCSVSAERWLADAWTPEQRAAFLRAAADEPDLAAAARVAASLLDARRGALELEWASVCDTSLLASSEAIVVRRCVERRHTELAAVARLLAQPSHAVLERSPRIAAELGTVGDCTLAARATSGARTDWSLAGIDARSHIHAAIAEAEVHRHAGEREPQAAALQRARTLALAQGAALSLAELDMHLGRMAIEEGRLDAGLQQVEHGYFAALAGGDELLAADTASRLVFLAGAQAHRGARGRDWAAHAGALFDKLDVDPVRRARLAAHLGALAESDDDAVASLAHYREALALLEGVDAPELRLVVLHGIAVGLQATGDAAASLDTFGELEPLMRAEYGERHPHYAVLANNVGATRQAVGEFAAALHDHARARDIAEAQGLDVLLVNVLTNTCFAHNSAGQAELGLPDCIDAVALCLEVFGPVDTCSSAYMALGNAWASLGAGEAAQAAYRTTFEMDAARWPVDDPNMVWAWSSLGAGALAVDDWIGALDAYERALVLGDSLPRAELAEIRFGLARAHEGLGRRDTARELAEQAALGFAADGHRPAADRARAWLADHPREG